MDYKSLLAEKISEIDRQLEIYMRPAYPEVVYEAAGYSLFSGGKRIRPVFLLAICDMLGGRRADALPFAASLEMLHTYSLIHDDLPPLDDDDTRRGKPTNHVVFGEAMALLAGDALLNRGYEAMADFCAAAAKPHFVRAMAKIAKYAGIEGMIGGQVMDICLEDADATADEVEYVYTNKTAKLFMAAFGAGALVAGQDDETVSAMEDIGRKLGIAFQIRDDLLDIQGGAAFGKPIGSDEKNNKSTYIKIFGAARAESMCAQLSAEAIDGLRRQANSQFMVWLAKGLIDRTR